MRIPAFQICEGDLIDLEGDSFADPNRDNVQFESELQQVVYINHETYDCIAIGFEGFDIVGFPPDHLLTVCASGRDGTVSPYLTLPVRSLAQARDDIARGIDSRITS